MEDYVVSEFKQANNNKELGLFAIFDGHSGHDVANYLQRNLFENRGTNRLCYALTFYC